MVLAEVPAIWTIHKNKHIANVPDAAIIGCDVVVETKIPIDEINVTSKTRASTPDANKPRSSDVPKLNDRGINVITINRP